MHCIWEDSCLYYIQIPLWTGIISYLRLYFQVSTSVVLNCILIVCRTKSCLFQVNQYWSLFNCSLQKCKYWFSKSELSYDIDTLVNYGNYDDFPFHRQTIKRRILNPSFCVSVYYWTTFFTSKVIRECCEVWKYSRMTLHKELCFELRFSKVRMFICTGNSF